MANRMWTDEQVLLLKECFCYKTERELAELLPYSIVQIRSKAKKLGLKKGSDSYLIHIWTPEEDAQLTELYKNYTVKEMVDFFENISESQIKNRINRLGLSKIKTKWTNELVEYLVKNFNEKSPKEMQKEKLIGFTNSQISRKAQRLGLTEKRIYWSKEEVEILTLYYPNKTNKEIRENYLPSRTISQIKTKAKSMNLKKSKMIKYKAILDAQSDRDDCWTEEEKKLLAEHYGNMNNKLLQKIYLPNRTLDAIKAKAKQLGTQNKTRNYFVWQQEELETEAGNSMTVHFSFIKTPVE